jgi:hypothetical protein
MVTAKPRLITLEAHNVALGRVLEEIASKTGTRVHYSILPKERVTATCAGETIKAIMKCLLGPDADFMVRSASESSGEGDAGRAVEVWVLGSSFANGQVMVDRRDSDSCTMADATKKPEPEDTDKLLEMAREGEPAQRANAIARLVTNGHIDEGLLRTTLERALSDEDANVRAQAVYGLARQGDASAVLRTALHDGDASVRLMAVDSADASVQGLAVLREALADSDEVVSALAALKLESFTHSGLSR